jgi:hypothetical protein
VTIRTGPSRRRGIPASELLPLSRLSMVISSQNLTPLTQLKIRPKTEPTYPMLKIEIYHAANKVRALLS